MNHAEAPKESVVNIHEPRNTLTDLLAPMMDLAQYILDDRRENYAVGNVKYLWKHLLRT
jgi:hypothetical protein